MVDRDLPYMPLYWGDLMRKTASLTAAELGALLRLWNEFWSMGPIKGRDDRLAQIVGVPLAQWRKMRPNLEPFFDTSTGDWTPPDIDILRRDALERSARNSERARRAAGARYAGRGSGARTSAPRVLRALPGACQSESESEKIGGTSSPQSFSSDPAELAWRDLRGRLEAANSPEWMRSYYDGCETVGGVIVPKTVTAAERIREQLAAVGEAGNFVVRACGEEG